MQQDINFIFNGLTPEEKLENLRSLSTRAEKSTYSRTMDEAELQAEEKQYIRKQTDLARLKIELKEINDDYKAKISGLSDDLEEGLKRINNGKREVVGTLFHIPNHASGKMLMYDANGEMIDSRPLKPEERQARAFIDGPDGTKPNPDDIDIEHEDLEDAIVKMEEGEPRIADPKQNITDGKNLGQVLKDESKDLASKETKPKPNSRPKTKNKSATPSTEKPTAPNKRSAAKKK